MILEGKVALVTGSTSGIGLAIARALTAEGAKVMLNGFGDAAEIDRIKTELGALHDGADLSDPAQIESMVRHCSDELGAPDILVNNAGLQQVSPVESFPPEKWDAILAINLSAVFHTTRLAIPAIKQKGWGGSSTPPRRTASSRAPTSRPTSPQSMVSPVSPRRSRSKPRRTV